MSGEVSYLAQIEGIGNGTGQVFYCYPTELPDYADAAYNGGLEEPPTGVGSDWTPEKRQASAGTFRVKFRRNQGPVPFALTRPEVISSTFGTHNASILVITHGRRNVDAGIVAGDILYINRETFEVFTATPAAATFEVLSRGYAGSTAQPHPDRSPIFRYPPALTGRKVTVYKTPRVGGSAPVTDDIILQGFINGEPAGSLFGMTIGCIERFDAGLLGEDPADHQVLVGEHPDRPGIVDYVRVVRRAFGPHIPPIGSADGAYFYIPKLEAVYAVPWDDTTETWNELSRRLIWSKSGGVPEMPAEEAFAYLDAVQMLWSDRFQTYQYGGYLDPEDGAYPAAASFQASHNPVVLALNHIMSLDGTNGDTGAEERIYDRGAHIDAATGDDQAGGLFPRFALGWPRAQVDLAAFERAAAEVDNLPAPDLWLGAEPETFGDLMYRLVGLLGYTVCTKRDGTITILRIGDIYPGSTLEVIDSDSLTEPNNWTHQAMGRAVDSMLVHMDTGPDGQSYSTVTIREITQQGFYPPHTGQQDVFQKTPFRAVDFSVDSFGYDFVAVTLRRYAGRLAFIGAAVNITKRDTVDIGDPVSLHDVQFFDPTSGVKLLAADDPLQGHVVSSDPQWGPTKEGAGIRVLIEDEANVALMSPSAKVSNYVSGTNIVECYSHQVTRPYGDDDEDVEHFSVGDVLQLVDKHGVGVSDDGATYPTEVVSVDGAVSPPEIEIDRHFRDSGGVNITTITDGDWVIFATYDAVTTAQKELYGHDASGGLAASGDPELGTANDPPYVYGDGDV